VIARLAGASRRKVTVVLLLVLAGCGQSAEPTGADPTGAGTADGQVSGSPVPGTGTGTGTVSPSGSVASPGALTGGAPGSTVRGTYREGEQGSGPGQGVAGVTVGLYTDSFLPGTNAMAGSSGAGGRLVGETVTARSGAFVLQDVPSGTWFLVATDAQVATGGVWVRVTAVTGVAADLSGCTDCPAPQ